MICTYDVYGTITAHEMIAPPHSPLLSRSALSPLHSSPHPLILSCEGIPTSLQDASDVAADLETAGT